MKVSFITTVYNEELTIKPFLESIFSQSKFPDEIIIVDGSSTDKTVSEISSFKFPKSRSNTKIKLIFKKGNRSVGRNEAIKKSSNEIIVCSDAGCVMDKNWVKNITKPFINLKVDVVAGYYRGIAKTVFQECLVPYVLVMPDRISRDDFLPATRSMAFRKATWKKIGGFPEEFSNNEDYVFARRLKKAGFNIFFEKNAVVTWIPRENIKDAFRMFYRFAKGDAESNILRIKVLLLFARYGAGLILLAIYLKNRSSLILMTLCVTIIAYLIWSVLKNFRYVKSIWKFYYFPELQIVSDMAVILGTVIGFLSSKKPKS